MTLPTEPRAAGHLGTLAWTQVRAESVVLIVPLGATEQHGPHLPLATDTLVAEALARDLVGMRPDLLVAPTIPYGSSGEHAGFPGTLSIGQDVLESLVIELVRSADAFAGMVLVSGHGGNAEPLSRAVARLGGEGRRALAWWPTGPVLSGTGPVDAHAGSVETSILLHLHADLVGDRLAPASPIITPLSRLMPRLRAEGVRGVSPSGVLGDPSGASAERGGLIMDALAADLRRAVRIWLELGPGVGMGRVS